MSLVAVFTYRRLGDTRGLQLVFCWVVHMILDQMWLKPDVLLWPISRIPSGSHFGVSEFEGYMVHSLATDPSQFVPELLGLSILLWFGKRLIQQGQVMNFLKTGRGDGGRRQDAPTRWFPGRLMRTYRVKWGRRRGRGVIIYAVDLARR